MRPAIVVSSKEHLSSLIFEEIRNNGVRCSLNHLDVSNLRNMSYTFSRFPRFNGDISLWNVGHVQEMDHMFCGSEFNGNVSNWNTGNVINMRNMFSRSKFNSDISSWNTNRVQCMDGMFEQSMFTGNISSWDVANVLTAAAMFEQSQFDGDISLWNTKRLCSGNAKCMFKGSQFSGNLSHWSLGHTTVMLAAFDKNFRGVLPTSSRPINKKFYENLFGGQKELGRYLRKQPFSGAHFDVLRKSKKTIFLVPQELHAWSHAFAQAGLAIGMDDNTLRICAMEQYGANHKGVVQHLQMYDTDELAL